MAEIILLSIIQGVTEFLPVSSSAHLILFSKYFDYNNSNLVIDVSLHLGSLLAIIFYFKKDFQDFLKNKILFTKIIIATIPVAIFGFFLTKLNYMNFIRSYEVIGWTTIIFGLLLFVGDATKISKNINNHLNYKNAIIIGVCQILALIPGVSRSGIIITTSRFLKFSRVDAAKISFLTAIPVLFLASVYNFQKIIIENDFIISTFNFVGVLFSFLFSYITIKFFLVYLKKFNLLVFVIYRIILGIIILIYVYN